MQALQITRGCQQHSFDKISVRFQVISRTESENSWTKHRDFVTEYLNTGGGLDLPPNFQKGGLVLKRRTWTVCWFKRGLSEKEGVVFLRGGDTPMQTKGL